MASNNTSKTAHVMNLLSKNRGGAAEPPTEPQADPAAPAAPEAEPAPQTEAAPKTESAAPAHAAPVAPIISSITADAAVSSQIKGALEAELEQAPKSAAPAAPEAEPTPVQPPVSEELPAAVEPSGAPEEEESASYINVMQILVDEKADEYMKMFGICCCDKCRVDVRAYALNHLPPKYVVLSENERVPRLTVYENRFASDITAQLIQACKQVMLRPHHSRPEN